MKYIINFDKKYTENLHRLENILYIIIFDVVDITHD